MLFICEAKHYLGVANGLDALALIFRAYIELGIMQKCDEVFVPTNARANARHINQQSLKASDFDKGIIYKIKQYSNVY